MKKMLMLASIALVTALGCDQNDRSTPADRTTTPPPATTPGTVGSGAATSPADRTTAPPPATTPGTVGSGAATSPADRTTTPPPATTPGTVGSGAATSRLPTMTDTDRALAQRVEETLRQDAVLASAAQNIQVHANNDQVTLMGSVGSQQEKTDLGSKAQQVTGVARVDNQLTVASANR